MIPNTPHPSSSTTSFNVFDIQPKACDGRAKITGKLINKDKAYVVEALVDNNSRDEDIKNLTAYLQKTPLSNLTQNPTNNALNIIHWEEISPSHPLAASIVKIGNVSGWLSGSQPLTFQDYLDVNRSHGVKRFLVKLKKLLWEHKGWINSKKVRELLFKEGDAALFHIEQILKEEKEQIRTPHVVNRNLAKDIAILEDLKAYVLLGADKHRLYTTLIDKAMPEAIKKSLVGVKTGEEINMTQYKERLISILNSESFRQESAFPLQAAVSALESQLGFEKSVYETGKPYSSSVKFSYVWSPPTERYGSEEKKANERRDRAVQKRLNTDPYLRETKKKITRLQGLLRHLESSLKALEITKSV